MCRHATATASATELVWPLRLLTIIALCLIAGPGSASEQVILALASRPGNCRFRPSLAKNREEHFVTLQFRGTRSHLFFFVMALFLASISGTHAVVGRSPRPPKARSWARHLIHRRPLWQAEK